MKTQIFCDIADYKTIEFYSKKKIVNGFTTNPSLMRLAGAKNYKDYSKKILKVCNNKPVSLEVFGDNHKSMIEQAININSWGQNIYVKIPCVNSKGVFCGKSINYLSNLKIKLNITAVYSFTQVKQIVRVVNKKSKTIISIFAGRMGDKGKDPLPEIIKSIKHVKKFKNIKILWASTREAYNYLQAKQVKCHIITMPPSIIDKISKFGGNYKKFSVDTVKGFLKDSKKSNFKIN